MKSILVAYHSVGGNTEKMAEYIAEGIRFSGNQAVLKKIQEFKNPTELAGYDSYIFGSPTYHQDTPSPMKTFLDLAQNADLKGKLAGAFSSYHHDVGYTPGVQASDLILETMQKTLQMEPFNLGALKVKDTDLGLGDGMKACQDYGRVLAENLGS